MHKIHVKQTYNRDQKTLFNLISDHAQFLSGKNLNCELIKTGNKDKNGVGAIRKVMAGKLIFEEKILTFVPYQSFSYVILSINPKQPIKHKKGWLEFSSVNGKTQVDWHSHFQVTTPIIGAIIGFIVKKQMSKAFLGLLHEIKNKS